MLDDIRLTDIQRQIFDAGGKLTEGGVLKIDHGKFRKF